MLNQAVEVIAEKFATLEPVLDERARRLWAAAEARAIGRGGISRVAEATGLSRITIRAGLRELHPPSAPTDRQARRRRTRRHGGGRKPLTEHDPKLLACLGGPGRSGDPWRPDVAAAVDVQECRPSWRPNSRPLGHRRQRAIGQPAACTPRATACSPTARPRRASDHPDRDAQFEHINRRVKAFQRQGQPVVSVDTKKKELVGDSGTAGGSGSPRASPRR